MKCPVCNVNELTGKQKTCSAACRVKLSRLDAPKGGPEEAQVPKMTPTTSSANKRVRTAENRPEPGSAEWYVHGPERSGVCVLCGKDFKTTLPLMRFCSEECKSDVMIVIAKGPHPNYLKAQK